MSRHQDTQVDRFQEMARKLGCDEDKERFEAQLGRIARQKPEPKKEKARPDKKTDRAR